MNGQTDGHVETSIPPYNFAAGGIIIISWTYNNIQKPASVNTYLFLAFLLQIASMKFCQKTTKSKYHETEIKVTYA